MPKRAKTETVEKPDASRGVKIAERRWDKDGAREDQDYYHIPGSPKVDHEEAHAATDRKQRKGR